MARYKNAKREHFVQPYIPGVDEPGIEWLKLGTYIETIEIDNNEETEDTGFYDGDGSIQTDIVSVTVGYGVEGYYDAEDPAQQMLADLEFDDGEKRKIWHKRVNPQKTKEWVGKATVADLEIGGGAATEYEAFKCKISWDGKPVLTAIPVV